MADTTIPQKHRFELSLKLWDLTIEKNCSTPSFTRVRLPVWWQHDVTAYAPGRITMEETFFLANSETALVLASLTFFKNRVQLQLLRALMGPARQLTEITQLLCQSMSLLVMIIHLLCQRMALLVMIIPLFDVVRSLNLIFCIHGLRQACQGLIDSGKKLFHEELMKSISITMLNLKWHRKMPFWLHREFYTHHDNQGVPSTTNNLACA